MCSYSSSVRPSLIAAARSAVRFTYWLHAVTSAPRRASIMEPKKTRPSEPPASASSTEFSGCGIMPNTLRVSLQTPAMSSREPLGLAPSARSPAALT